MQRSKRVRAVSYSVAVLLGGLVAFGGDARAQTNFSQYLAGKAGDNTAFSIWNPTMFEMIALGIEFDAVTGDFAGCQGAIIDPFGADDDSITPGGSGDSAGVVLILAVPTTAAGTNNAGKIKAKRFGLIASALQKSGYMPSLNPKNFKLHPDPTEREAELAACCTEIENLAEPENIFKAFKIECPAFD